MSVDVNKLKERLLLDTTIPDVIRNALESGAHIDPITLDKHGDWWHRGERIEHRALLNLFSRSIVYTEGGTSLLSIPPFKYPVIVEDTPYFVTRVEVDKETNSLAVSLSDDTREQICPSLLLYTECSRLIVPVKNGTCWARFKRRPYHDLLSHVEDVEGRLQISIGEKQYPIGVEDNSGPTQD